MKVGLILATEGQFPVEGAAFVATVRAAQGAGFDSMRVGEHVVMPAEQKQEYPRDSQALACRGGHLGDGSFPSEEDVDHLGNLIAFLRRAAERVGRDSDAIEMTDLGSRGSEAVARSREPGFASVVLFLFELTVAGVERLGLQASWLMGS